MEFTDREKNLPVREIEPSRWYLARSDSDLGDARDIPSLFFGNRSSLQFLSAEDQATFMTLYLDCISLINEGIASFDEYPDWCPDAEVLQWMDYSYQYFPTRRYTRHTE